MALLNFTSKYQNVAKYKDLTASSPSLEGSQENDYVKLIFTKDGHIITHGTDYIPWGDGTIPIEKLPIATDDTYNNETLWTSETIFNKINNSFLANEAMRFKGSIGIEGRDYTINGERTPDGTLPKGEVGDTYRVSTNGRYGGNDCEVGDLLICYESGTTKENDRWTVVQTNINGYSTFQVNAIPYSLYTAGSTTPFEIYAPTAAGEEGYILLWHDGNAVWAGRDALNIGKSLTTGNGSGLKIGTDNIYNGSADRTISLLQATTGSIGGVIIDSDGLQLNGKPTEVTDDRATVNGATISISPEGVIYLTQKNIINALGYAPEGMGAVKSTWRPIKVNDKDFLDSNAAGASLNIGSNNSTIVITPSTNNSGKVSFDVNLDYDTTKDTPTSGLNRVAVKAGEGTNLGRLYVEIPEYAVVSNEINGLAPKITTNETDKITPDYSILASKEGTSAGWYKLDINEINTWRPISIDGNDIGSKKFSIVDSQNIYIGVNQKSGSDTYEIGFELQWKEWEE